MALDGGSHPDESVAASLHDATLLHIELDWPGGSAAVRFRAVPGVAVVLRASGVLGVSVPRRHPWGPSISVNSAHLSRSQDGTDRLDIEMQSGDAIVVEASNLVLQSDT